MAGSWLPWPCGSQYVAQIKRFSNKARATHLLQLIYKEALSI
jgi:hypothetical protein